MGKAGDLAVLTPQNLRATTGDARLVVLFPQTGYRDAYLSKYLKEPASGFYYYALRVPDRNLRRLLLSLVEELDAMTGHFGSSIRQAIAARATAPSLAEVLSRDLDELSSEPFTLLLDQFDRLPEKDETKRFMATLVETLPAQCQVLLNARDEAYLPWYDLVSAGRAAVVGAEFAPTSTPLAPDMAAGELPQIEVFALGSGHVLVNGKPILQWDGELPGRLCLFFIDRQHVTRDEIFDVFWPTLSVKEATNVFHVTKRKMHEKLGVDLTKYEHGLYTYSDGVQVHYDVAEFIQAVTAAREATADEKQRLCRRAVALYRAPFLHRMEMAWAQRRRVELAALHQEALQGS